MSKHGHKVSFKKGSVGERVRKEIAEDIARRHPGISMAKKFRMSTGGAKRAVRSKRRKRSRRRR